MSFRLVVRFPGRNGIPGYCDCALASEALAVRRRLTKSNVQVEQILDLRTDEQGTVSAAELEALAQRERVERQRASP